MRISTKLKIVPIIVLAMMLASILVSKLAFRDILSDSAYNNTINHVIVDIYKLSGLTNEFLQHYEERPKEQWLLLNKALTLSLNRLQTEDEQSKHYLSLLKSSQAEITRFFIKITQESYPRSKTSGDSQNHSQLTTLLHNQMHVMMHEMVSSSQQLSEKTQSDQISQHEITGWVLFGIIVMSGCTFTLISLILSRSILQPLKELSLAAENIGAGNLSYQIRSERKDEIGELFSNFDRMANRLQQAITARNNLQNEVNHLDRVAVLGTLTAALAHEINQPLAAILSNAQAAIRFLRFKQPDLNNVEEALLDIVDDDKRAAVIIRRLRTLLGNNENKSEPTDINNCVHEIVSLIKNDALLKKVVIKELLPLDLPKTYCDKIQIQQVILNLLVNAVDSVQNCPPNRRLINISTAMHVSNEVRICISDNGYGIPPHLLTKLFEPFLTTKKQGLGMGLPICKRIVEQHHGKIWARNNKDTGASFHFTLPVYKPETPYSMSGNGVE